MSKGLHHPVFSRFSCWQGTVPAGFVANFLGVLTWAGFWKDYSPGATDYVEQTNYPDHDEEYFEWIDLLEAVCGAAGRFTMLELGAGWGRWVVNAAFALKQVGGLPCELVAVEPEPTHFKWLGEHACYNGLKPENLRMIEAAVTGFDGRIGFYVGDFGHGGPRNCYGHSTGGPVLVDAVSLNTLLLPYDLVDLIDLDVQGMEEEVLQAAMAALSQKVKRVHIGTHSRAIDEGLVTLFTRLGWTCLRCYQCMGTAETEYGAMKFQDGVQSWVNPRLLAAGQPQGAV